MLACVGALASRIGSAVQLDRTAQFNGASDPAHLCRELESRALGPRLDGRSPALASHASQLFDYYSPARVVILNHRSRVAHFATPTPDFATQVRRPRRRPSGSPGLIWRRISRSEIALELGLEFGRELGRIQVANSMASRQFQLQFEFQFQFQFERPEPSRL